jgi:hypothetical protein
MTNISTFRFTREQEDYICYIIGNWYIKWKDNMTDGTPHRLGIAKEALKEMFCELVVRYKSHDILINYVANDEWVFRIKPINSSFPLIESGWNNYLSKDVAMDNAKKIIDIWEKDKE